MNGKLKGKKEDKGLEERRRRSIKNLEKGFFEGKSEKGKNLRNPGSEREKGFWEIGGYVFHYLCSSDYLGVEHEKFLLGFFGEKKEEEMNLMVFHLRFSYVELAKLFTIARDVESLKRNELFISKLDFEIQQRMNSGEPFDRSRKAYCMDLYKSWDFKKDLMSWLIETDHHEVFNMRIDRLLGILAEKENKINEQETLLRKFEADRKQIFVPPQPFKQQNCSEEDKGEKKRKVSIIPSKLIQVDEEQCSFSYMVKNNCSVF